MNYKKMTCAWCGTPAVDGAHVPTKFLIEKRERGHLRTHWPIVPGCVKCNQGLKLDEEWFAVHFCSVLYEFSPKAKSMFDGPITRHLRNSPHIADRYYKYLSLVELKVGDISLGTKTQVKIGNEDWRRLKHVADMFARGLYYWHSGKSANQLKTTNVYLNPQNFGMLSHHFQGLTYVPLFPDVFEYAFGLVTETNEAVFYIIIYGKPSFFILLTTPERYEAGESRRNRKIILGEIDPNQLPGIEILG